MTATLSQASRLFRPFVFIALLGSVLLGLGSPCRAGSDAFPVLNPSFEKADGDMPAGWEYWQSKKARNVFTLSDAEARTGTRSGRIEVESFFGCWLPEQFKPLADTAKQPSDMKPQGALVSGREYVLSAWFKRKGGKDQMYASVKLRTADGNGWLSGTFGHINTAILPLPEDGRWHVLTVALKSSKSADFLVPLLQMQSTGQTGELFVDDAAIVDRTGLSCDVTGPMLTDPDGHRWELRLRVRNDREEPMELTATAEPLLAGAEPARQTAIVPPGGERAFRLAFDAARPCSLNYTLAAADNDRLIYFGGPKDVPALPADAYVASPLYRATLFADTPGDSIVVACDLPATPEALQGATLRAQLRNGEKVLAEAFADARPGENRLRLDRPTLPKGKYPIALSLLRQGAEVGTATLTLTSLPDLTPRVRFGDHNEMVLNGELFLPVGFYITPGYVPTLKELKDLKKRGFNTLIWYNGSVADNLNKMLPLCEKAGMKLIASCAGLGRGRVKSMPKFIPKLKKSPAMIGHYHIDEPQISRGQTPEALKSLYDLSVRIDPGLLNASVFHTPYSYRIYADTVDVFMIDPYPFVEQNDDPPPVEMVAMDADRARDAVRGRKPVWIVPATFDGWGFMGNRRFVMPTIPQQRCATFLALTHGAKGIVNFTYNGFFVRRPEIRPEWRGKRKYYRFEHTLPEAYPLTFDALSEIAQQVGGLKEVLLAPDPEQTQKIIQGGEAVHTLLKEHDGAWYLLAVNPKNRPVAFACSLPGLSGKAEVLWEDRTVESPDGTLTDSFEPYGVHVYRWTK